MRTGSLSPLPPDLKNPLSISSSQQHIYAEDQAMRSSRMRQDFGLVTPRKEGGFGRGADPDGELNTSAYSLVELYNGTPRKKQPPPQEAIISGCAGDACQEHVTTRFFRAESGEEGEAVMSVGDACASNVGQKSAPTKRACPSLIDVGERRNSHRQGDGEPLTIEALGEGMRVDAEGNRAVLIVKRSEVSPATALSGTLTGMHLQ